MLTKLLPPQHTTMLEPEKLKYALSTVMRFLERESSKDKFKSNNNLSNFEYQLDKLITNRNERERVQRDGNEGNLKAKTSLQYETSMMYRCKYILGTLVNFINNAYIQVANYCTLTGKCNAKNSSPLNLNFNDELNVLSQNTMSQNLLPLNDFKHDMTKGVLEYKTPLTEIWKENTMPQVNQETKQDYDIMNILQNYKPNSDINQANDVSNTYPVDNMEYRKQKYNGLLNSFVNSDKLDYTLNENIFPQQSPSSIPDFNNLSFKDIFSTLTSLYNTKTNQKDTKMLADADNNIPMQSFGHNNINNNDFQSIYQNLNSLSFDSKNAEATNDITKFSQLSSPEQPLFNNNIYSTNAFENKRYKFSQLTPTNIDSSTQIKNPFVVSNENHLQDKISSFFQQGSQQNPQYLTNYNNKPELLNKIQQQYVGIPNNVNLSPYPYQSYKESLNQNTHIFGLNRVPQNTLTVPNLLTSQYNNYDIPRSINTNVADNIKHENYGTQLPDSSQPLSVSNLVKLNSVTRNYGDVELTFMLKRSQPVYEPIYYVKYRMPYNEFLYNMQNLLIQKPNLRTKPNQLYQALLSGSNVIKTSENFKDLNDAEIVKLTSTNGTFVTAKLLQDRDIVENEQLKLIQDLNANLSVANLLNLSTNNNQILEPIQNLLKATMSATDYSFQSDPDAGHSRILNKYSNSEYNTPVAYQPSSNNYNPYSKIVDPAYSAFYGIPSTGFNTLPNNIVEKLLAENPQSDLNTYPQLAG
ncbi:putative uncharacterized protein DDB_G0267716 [Vanessa atalanta]|uniref:putative uncharacterized protein DDB_G0267716 n=1 Tax=Vanessa atalanta TaxID=42275 RepID=UPI001FCE13C9|nr:putative uncharacterized protein DDB_G0267716 [Vanessa atalanta]